MQSIALGLILEIRTFPCYDVTKEACVLKKILKIDFIVMVAVLLISLLISAISKFLLTDLIFIGSMFVLLAAIILLISARIDMKATIKKMKKSEKGQVIKVFQWSEKLAMTFVIVTMVLFVISFGLT